MATFTVTSSSSTSLPPKAVGNLKIIIGHGATHIFTIANLTTETVPPYQDPENDPMSKFKILTATYANGGVFLSGVAVTVGQEIDHTDITSGLLTYIDDSTNAVEHTSDINFTLSDQGSNQYCTLIGLLRIVILDEVNLAPTEVGDGEETIGYGEDLVFTRAMFTTETDPAYADPEGDVADLLKITALPTSGIIKLNGIVVTLNQEINFTDIDSSLLVFTGDVTSLAGGTDTFTFEIADVGSGIFVS